MKKKSYIFPFIYLVILFLILILLIFLFLFLFKYFLEKKEGFFIQEKQFNNNNNKTIILLGDSILNNHSYVSLGDSIEDLLKKRTNDSIYNFAQDDATIQNAFHQINKIPEYLNNHNTNIFLSLGGNDIIHHYIKNNNNLQNVTILNHLFRNFKRVVYEIHRKMNKSHVFVLDIYYPKNVSFQIYKPILQEWNKLLETHHNENNENMTILKISQELTQSQDFTNNIEPSKIGGEKIVNIIFNALHKKNK